MAIPLFTGAANIGALRGRGSVIPSIDPAAYIKGAQAAKELGATNTAGQIANAVTAGVQSFEAAANQEQTRQLNNKNLQLNEIKMRQAEQDLAINAQLAPIKARADIAQKQAQALKEASEAEKIISETALKKEKLQSQRLVGSIFQTIKGGNVEEGITALENNFQDLVDVGFPDDSSRGNRKGVDIDRSVLAGVSKLVQQAKATGDPDLVNRAQDIVQEFRSVGKRLGQASKGEEFSFGDEQQPEVKDELDVALERAGATLKSKGTAKAAPEQSVANSQVDLPDVRITKDASPSPTVGGPERTTSPYASPRDFNKKPYARPFNFPEELPEPPPAVGGQESPEEAEYNKYTENILADSDTLNEQIDATKRYLVGRDPALAKDPYKLEEAARKRVKDLQLQPTQLKQYNSLQQAADIATTTAQRARSAMTRLQKLMNDEGITLSDGKTKTFAQIMDLLSTRFAGKNRARVDQVDAEFEAIGAGELLRTLSEMNLGVRLADTPKEQELLRSLSISKSNTIERNLQALDIIEGKAQELNDVLNIVNGYRRLNRTWEEATTAASRFKRAYPGLTTGEINGLEFTRRNSNRISGTTFLTNELGIYERVLRDDDGRALRQDPADIIKESNTISRELESGGKIDSNYSDIPDKHQDGASPHLIRAVIGAESAGDSEAVSSAGAKGVMQLMDATGKALWKELKFDGEYDPFDKEKNIIMGTTYLNKQLDNFMGDTRLALAAYNAGPGTIDKALKKATENLGRSDWDAVKHYLPEKAKKETIPYVEKIMGSREDVKAEVPTPIGEDLGSSYASLSTVNAQNNARAFLTPEGTAALREIGDLNDVKDVVGTRFEPILRALTSANPFGASTAEAQEPDSGEQKQTQEGPSLESLGKGIQAFSLGAVRTMLFGFEDEGAAALRSMLLGEDYDQALETVRTIREQFIQENPNMYLTGELSGAFLAAPKVAGAVVSAATKGINAAKSVVGLGVAESSSALPAVETFGSTVLKSVGSGAAAGAIQGFGEGEGGVETRTEKAITGGVLGAGLGAVLGTALGGISAGATSNVAKKTFSKLREMSTGKGGNIEFEPAEKELLNQLVGYGDDWFKETISYLKNVDNEAASFADKIGKHNLELLIDKATKTPETVTLTENLATQRIAGYPERVKNTLNKVSDDIEPEQAFSTLANSVEKDFKNILTARKNLSTPKYQEAKDSLPVIATKYRKAKTSRAVPEEGMLVDPYGNVLSETKIYNRYQKADIIPEETPAFLSDEVNVALAQSPEAVSLAHKQVDPNNILPDNAFDIVQQSKINLYRMAQRAEGNEKRLALNRYHELRDAMHGEAPALKEADEIFLEGSKDADKYASKLVESISAHTDAGSVLDQEKIGDILFKSSPATLRNALKNSSPETQVAYKNAARAHILNLIGKRGDESTKAVDFTKNKLPEKIKAIFGDQAGAKILKSLQEESKILRTSNIALNRTGKSASGLVERRADTKAQLISRIGEVGYQATTGTAIGGPKTGIAVSAYASWRAVMNAMRFGRIKSEEELAGEIGRILLVSRPAAIQFANKALAELKKQDSRAYELFDRAYITALKNIPNTSRGLSQTTTAEYTDFQPQSDRIRNKLRGKEPFGNSSSVLSNE